MKEYLKLVGIRWYIFPISMFIHSFCFYSIISALITIATKVKLPPANINGSFYSYKALFENTDSMIVFSTLFVYSIQLPLFTILLAQFFSKRMLEKFFLFVFFLKEISQYSFVYYLKKKKHSLPKWLRLFYGF
jgi:hypothetical protein